jgi:hypothetical protein
MTLLAAASAMSAAFAADGFSATVDIASSLFSVQSATERKSDALTDTTTTNTVDSLVKDADFDATEFAFAYEGGNWGAAFGLGFKPGADPITDAAYENTRIGSVFEFNTVTGWVKFGDAARLQAGQFTSRSVNRRTADINDYKLGVFFPRTVSENDFFFSVYGPGVYGHKSDSYETYSAPGKIEGDKLNNGLLASLYAGPATFDLLFAPNIDLKRVSADEKARSYLYGARAAAQIGDIAKVTATFKQERATGTASKLAALWGLTGIDAKAWLDNLENTKKYDNTFGVFAETDAVPGLGITVGYTGYLPVLDVSNDVVPNHESTLYSGIDLRAQYAATDALSVSTHDNVSFASGKEKSAFFLGKDQSYVSLYNALGATYRLNDAVKLVGEVENEYASYKYKHDDKSATLYNEYLAAVAKTVYAVSPNASVSGGLKFEYSQSGASGKGEERYGTGNELPAANKSAVFSVPVGFTFAW